MTLLRNSEAAFPESPAHARIAVFPHPDTIYKWIARKKTSTYTLGGLWKHHATEVHKRVGDGHGAEVVAPGRADTLRYK